MGRLFSKAFTGVITAMVSLVLMAMPAFAASVNPATGDNSGTIVTVMVILLVASAAVVGGLIISSKKK